MGGRGGRRSGGHGGGAPEGGTRLRDQAPALRADKRGTGLGQALDAYEAFARACGDERNWFVLVEEIDDDWEDNVYEKRL